MTPGQRIEVVADWLQAYRQYRRYKRSPWAEKWLVDGLRHQYQVQGIEAMDVIANGYERMKQMQAERWGPWSEIERAS